MRRIALVVAVTAIAALAISCTTSSWDTSGIDDPTPTTEKVYATTEAGVIESLTDHLSEVGSNLNEWAAPRDEANCAARKIVDRLSVDRLLDLGYDPQVGKLALQYTDDERIALSNILDGCIDVAAGLNSMFAGYGKLGVTASRCLTEGIERKGLARDFISGILTETSPDPFAEENQLGVGVSRLMLECFVPESDLTPVAPVSPFPQDIEVATTTTADS